MEPGNTVDILSFNLLEIATDLSLITVEYGKIFHSPSAHEIRTYAYSVTSKCMHWVGERASKLKFIPHFLSLE